MTTREDIDMLTRRINKCMGETREFYHVINGNCRWHLRDESGREYCTTSSKAEMVRVLEAMLLGINLGLSRAAVNHGWNAINEETP
jgi:hypothetical protein